MNFLKEKAAKLKDLEDKHKLSEKAKDAFTEAKKFDEKHNVQDKVKGFFSKSAWYDLNFQSIPH